jgi:AcrR family transcriptional regulator
MVKKAPRRTAERILEVTLELFNRFGEPNVSTTLISCRAGHQSGQSVLPLPG